MEECKRLFSIASFSGIYCFGDLLKTVQLAQIFPDSKTFVDMKLKASPEDTLAAFKTWQLNNPKYLKSDVQQFVDVSSIGLSITASK